MRRTVHLDRSVDVPTESVHAVLGDVASWSRWLPGATAFEHLDEADGIHRLRLTTPLTGRRPIDLEVLVGRRSVRLHEPGRTGADLEGRWMWSEGRIALELSVEASLFRFGIHRRLERVARGWLDALAHEAEQVPTPETPATPASTDETVVFRPARPDTDTDELRLLYLGTIYRLVPTEDAPR